MKASTKKLLALLLSTLMILTSITVAFAQQGDENDPSIKKTFCSFKTQDLGIVTQIQSS